jgi:hypothetical protein
MRPDLHISYAMAGPIQPGKTGWKTDIPDISFNLHQFRRVFDCHADYVNVCLAQSAGRRMRLFATF